jgi:ABC-type branched-subunit amino acid transport system substrate-binding protein
LRTIQPDGLQAAAIALFIQQQGWKEVAVIYTNDDYGYGVYQSFLTNVEGLDVTIENDEEDRVIRANPDGTFSEDTEDDVDEVLT